MKVTHIICDHISSGAFFYESVNGVEGVTKMWVRGSEEFSQLR